MYNVQYFPRPQCTGHKCQMRLYKFCEDHFESFVTLEHLPGVVWDRFTEAYNRGLYVKDNIRYCRSRCKIISSYSSYTLLKTLFP